MPIDETTITHIKFKIFCLIKTCSFHLLKVRPNCKRYLKKIILNIYSPKPTHMGNINTYQIKSCYIIRLKQ